MNNNKTSEGLLALLQEDNDVLKVHALEELLVCVDKTWHMVAEQVGEIEILYEDESFPERELAAFVCSKIYYHLEAIDQSLHFALNAGSRFNMDDKEDEYVQSLQSQCIDDYIRIRTDPDCGDKLDPRLEKIVENMLDNCFEEGQHKQALGIALEANRIDYVEKAIRFTGPSEDMLSHTFQLCETVVRQKEFRTKLFHLLLELYTEQLQKTGSADFRNVCKCLYFLDKPTEVAQILKDLLTNDVMMAYQTAFDLAEYEDGNFLEQVAHIINPPPSKLEVEGLEDKAVDKPEEEMSVDAPEAVSKPITQPMPVPEPLDPNSPKAKLIKILNGSFAEEIHLQILFTENHSDLVILKQMKDGINVQSGTLNMSIAAANAIMHCNTTVDQFLRDNLKWLSKFRNFDKFLSVAFIGMIHRGHVAEGKKVLQAYLPPAEGPIAGGGALYALGLIHTQSCTEDIREYMYKQLMDAESNEILHHGALLGNALISISSEDEVLYGEFNKILEKGSAVPGSGAGYALGLLMAGTMNKRAIDETWRYAKTDTHKKSEKVIRGACMGLALMCYSQEEKADDLIQEMMADRDFHLRFGACYAIGMAYACTASNKALRWLLDLAVSDVSDDVRRAATTAVGFVFANQPDQVPNLLRLLAKSFNPYVRYGAAAAISISCAGTANKKAWKLLETLSKDNVEFVRQGAHIATGCLFMQRNEVECPEVKSIREELQKIIGNKRRNDKMAKMGAILGMGILDAGGRNFTISMTTSTGQKRMKAIIGMCLFWQHWEWYPLVPMISLCFKATLCIGLNQDLNLPKQAFMCNAKPSLYAYPEPLKEEAIKEKKLLKKAELSTTAKVQARRAKKKKDKGEDTEMEDTELADKKVEEEKGDDKMEVDGEEKKEVEDKKEKEPEPDFFHLENPCRVTRSQREHVTLVKDSRYKLVNDRQFTGFVLLRNSNPSETEELVTMENLSAAGVYGDEPDPPADFVYTGTKDTPV